MGDVAMTIPVVLTLLKQYPKLKVSILTKPVFATLFKDIPEIEIIPANIDSEHKGLTGIYKLSQELKAHHFSAVADLHDVLRTKILKFFLFFQGLKIKSIKKGRKDKKALTRSKNKIFKALKPTTSRYADVFEALKYPISLSDPVFLNQRAIDNNFIKDLHFYKAKKHLGIAPFAAHDSKVYPADLMQECIKQLAGDKDLNIYLFGAKGQEMSRLHNWAHPYSNVYCIAGKYSLEKQLNLISHLDLMLSMDSGNGHLAAMFGVKVITIWGQTHPYAGFAPFLQSQEEQILPNRKIFPLLPTSVYGHKAIEGYAEVMRSIKPGQVVERVKQNLY